MTLLDKSLMLDYIDHIRIGLTESAKQHEVDQGIIKQLRMDLKVYTEALAKQLDSEQELRKMKDQLKPYKAAALIDGDGCIFLERFYADGAEGGMKAARILTSAIQDYMSPIIGPDVQVHIRIFYNKKGLSNTLAKAGIIANVDEFAVGVNKAADHCVMVDVGCQKEAADSKIRAFLEDSVRDIRTSRVFFGGCHDNGYVSFVQSFITTGFEGKLVLLPSYNEMAAGFRDLRLPSLHIPGLFITEKMGTPAWKPAALGGTPNSPKLSAATIQSYSQIVNKSLPASKSDQAAHSRRGSATVQRRPIPDVPLSKQKPPPCTLFYLADACKYDEECFYSHKYILEAHHYEEMRVCAKKSPCPHVNKGETCTWGKNCVYGHKCPDGPTCSFMKAGRCKFKGVDMHKEGL